MMSSRCLPFTLPSTEIDHIDGAEWHMNFFLKNALRNNMHGPKSHSTGCSKLQGKHFKLKQSNTMIRRVCSKHSLVIFIINSVDIEEGGEGRREPQQ